MEERTDAGKRIPRPCASSSAWLLPCLSRAPPALSPALPVPLEWYSGGRAGELWPLLPLRLTLPERVVEAIEEVVRRSDPAAADRDPGHRAAAHAPGG